MDAIHSRHFPLLKGLHVQFCDMGKATWCIHDGIGLACSGVEYKWRHRPQRLLRQFHGLRDGILSDGGEILLLMLLLIFTPFVPYLSKRLSIYIFKLVAEESTAVCCTIIESDQFFIAIFRSQEVHEACSVEVGISSDLKVHRGTFRLKTHNREKFVATIDDATEIHFVIATQRTSHTTSEPSLHEAGDTFMIPSGGIPTGHTLITPQGRNGMFTFCAHLRSEEFAPSLVTSIILVTHHDMGVLVVEELTITF